MRADIADDDTTMIRVFEKVDAPRSRSDLRMFTKNTNHAVSTFERPVFAELLNRRM